MAKKEVTHKEAIMNLGSRMYGSRSISQGMPPRTPESATPLVKGTQKETKVGIVKSAVKAMIPQSTPYQSSRPVGEITKPGDWKGFPATRQRMMINKGVAGKGGPGTPSTPPIDPLPTPLPTDVLSGGMGTVGYAINGSHMGSTVDQSFGTDPNMTTPDLNPTNLPQNIKSPTNPSNPDLSPAPQPNQNQPKSYLPGPSRVKSKGITDSIVKKMLQKINYKKSN